MENHKKRWREFLAPIRSHPWASAIATVILAFFGLAGLIGDMGDAVTLADWIAKAIIFMASGPVQWVGAAIVVGGAAYVFQDSWWPSVRKHVAPFFRRQRLSYVDKRFAQEQKIEELRRQHELGQGIFDRKITTRAGARQWEADLRKWAKDTKECVEYLMGLAEAEAFMGDTELSHDKDYPHSFSCIDVNHRFELNVLEGQLERLEKQIRSLRRNV